MRCCLSALAGALLLLAAPLAAQRSGPYAALDTEPSKTACGAADRCDKCPSFTVGLFDSDVRVARPTDEQKIWPWMHLYYFGAGARADLRNTDARTDCIRWIDGGVWNATGRDSADGSLRAGLTHPNLPPAGNLNGMTYFVESEVTGAEGSYQGTSYLKDARSREVVASHSVSFADPLTALEMGQQAGRALVSAFDRIRKYQREKADRTNGFIAPVVAIRPARDSIGTLQTVQLEIQLYDCDGKPGEHPLIRRDVQLTATLGTLSRPTVTTLHEGKAYVDFEAGDKRGTAVITAHFEGESIDGYHETADTIATIVIGRGMETWEFQFNWEYSKQYRFDGLNGSGQEETMRDNEYAQAEVKGYVIGQQPDSASVTFAFPDSGWDPEERLLFTQITSATGRSVNSLLVNKRDPGVANSGYSAVETVIGEPMPPEEGLKVEGLYDPVEGTFTVSFHYGFNLNGRRNGRFWWTAGDPPRWETIADKVDGTGGSEWGACNEGHPDTSFEHGPRSVQLTCRAPEPDYPGNGETLTVTLRRIR